MGTRHIAFKNGFEADLPEDTMNNMEFVDLLAEDDNNPVVLSKMVTLLFGKDKKKELYERCRAEDGRVPVEAVSGCIEELFAQWGENGKNS